MNNLSARDALQASIINRLPQLSHDELRVFDVQLDRMLRIGRANYAPLDLSQDSRDWSDEIGQELSDALFYLCARHVAREDAKRERRLCSIADRQEAALASLIAVPLHVEPTDYGAIVRAAYELPDSIATFERVGDGFEEVLQ